MSNTPKSLAGTPAVIKPAAGWQRRLHEVIFESDTRAGQAFDILLSVCIFASILVVIVDSVASVHARYGVLLHAAEWLFTALFTAEYVLRLCSVRHPTSYVFSFFGVVDLLAIVPTYVSLLLPGTEYLLVIRVLRLLRVFRIFKLGEYLDEAGMLSSALWASRRKISVFLLSVISAVIIIGALIYVIEGPERGFTDIPTSMYWAIVTLTTVGYGDLAPKTAAGKTIASIAMLLGYAIIAVPTGIVTLEMSRAKQPVSNQACPVCGREGHDFNAAYCKFCGGKL